MFENIDGNSFDIGLYIWMISVVHSRHNVLYENINKMHFIQFSHKKLNESSSPLAPSFNAKPHYFLFDTYQIRV